MDPLEITETVNKLREPSRSTVPFPNCMSIWLSSINSALPRGGIDGERLIFFFHAPIVEGAASCLRELSCV